jgi:hypothetical protein
MIVYRGVNATFHEQSGGRLIPKESGPFLKSPEYGKSEFDNAYFGHNELNAIIEHQLHQSGYATCGISTTPHYDRAEYYASHGGEHSKGFVYEIDTSVCDDLEVKVYVVDETVPSPAIPEDEEVILVASECGELPNEIVSQVHEFGT